MALFRGTKVWEDLFDRAQGFTTTPGENGWTIADTSSGGAPTYLCITGAGGAAKLTLAATSEAENVCLYHNDVLAFDIDEIDWFKIVAKVAGVDAVTTLVMGLAGARNDTPDTVAQHAWFRMEGSASTSAVVVETDDGTNDNNDVATGKTLAAVYKEMKVDFTQGKSDVRFYFDSDRVASSTTFDMSNYTGQLQPLVQLQKASGTGVPAVTIAYLAIQFKYAYGA